MKKQLLILLVALLAIGVNTTKGQDCPIPRAVDTACLSSDALHPVAGIPYTYKVSVPTPPGTKEYTWLVTQSQTFMQGGALTAIVEARPGPIVLDAGANYNIATTGGDTIWITWNSFVYDPSQPIFVVIHVKNTASTPDGCVTNNMKVYKIEPMIAFTLDIANVSKVGVTQTYDDTIARCIHGIDSAYYSAAAPEGVVYDFGGDTLYYVVVAANYDSAWLPSVQIAGLDAEETVTAVQWDTSFAFNAPHGMVLAAGTYTSTDTVFVRNATGAVGPAGECIFVRVIIDHTNGTNNYEGLTDETITLKVDGITKLKLPTPVGDMHYSSTLPYVNTLCGLVDGFEFDLAVQTLKPRPDIIDATPPVGDDFLPVKP